MIAVEPIAALMIILGAVSLGVVAGVFIGKHERRVVRRKR